MGWALPLAGVGLAAGGAYLWGRSNARSRQQDDQYGPPYGPPYGRYAYAEYEEQDGGQEKVALGFLPGLAAHFAGGAIGGHVGLNAIGRQSHHHSNIHEVLAHRALKASLQGLELHPTRAASMKKVMGPESLASWTAASKVGDYLRQLSPEGQRTALRVIAASGKLPGLASDTPLLSPVIEAAKHVLNDTTPTLQATGRVASAHAKFVDGLMQHLVDPRKEANKNIFSRGLGHLRGLLPALGLVAADVPLGGFGLGALGHMGINEVRGQVADSRYGRDYMKNMLHAGAQGEPMSANLRLAREIGLSPAIHDLYDLGAKIRKTPAGLPLAMATAQEKATREQKLHDAPFMQAALAGREPSAGHEHARSELLDAALQGGAPGQSKAKPFGEHSGGGVGAFAKRHAPALFGIGALGTIGLAGYKGMLAGDEQSAREQDYMTHARDDMRTPLPSMTVKAGYDLFAEEKTATTYAFNPVYPSMQTAFTSSIANQIANKFVGEPIDAAHKALTKKLYDEPKQEAAFQTAVEGDEMLQEAHRQNPKALQETFSTLKTFAPSIAKNPSATRSFLRQAAMSGMHGGGPDFATIRLMAETEKFIQNAKGRGTGQ